MNKATWMGVFCLNLSKYKIFLQDLPDILGVVFITFNTIYFVYKKLLMKKKNKISPEDVLDNTGTGNISEPVEDIVGEETNSYLPEENDDKSETELELKSVESDIEAREEDADADRTSEQSLGISQKNSSPENGDLSSVTTSNSAKEESESAETATVCTELKVNDLSPDHLENTMENNYMLLFVLYGTLASSLTRLVKELYFENHETNDLIKFCLESSSTSLINNARISVESGLFY